MHVPTAPPSPTPSENRRIAQAWRAEMTARQRAAKLEDAVGHVEDSIAHMTEHKQHRRDALREKLLAAGADMCAVDRLVEQTLAKLPAVPAPPRAAAAWDRRAAKLDGCGYHDDSALRAALLTSENRIALVGQRLDAELDILIVTLVGRRRRLAKAAGQAGATPPAASPAGSRKAKQQQSAARRVKLGNITNNGGAANSDRCVV